MFVLNSGATFTDSPFVLFGNVLDEATFSGGTPAAGSEWENMLGPQTFDFYMPVSMNAVPGAVVPGPRDFDCMILADHNFGTIGLTQVYAQWRLDAADTWKTVFNILAPNITDDDICAIFPMVSGAEYRFAVVGPAAPRVGLWYVGKRLIFPGVLIEPYTPARLARRVETLPAVSAGNHYLGASAYRRASDRDAIFSPLPRAWVEADLLEFADHYNAGRPFFFGGSPLNLPADLSYSWRPENGPELRPALMAGGYASLQMGVAAYVA